MKLSPWWFVGMVLVALPASAAPRKGLDVNPSTSSASRPAAPVVSRPIETAQTLAALSLPFANSVAAVGAQGPSGYRNLISIMNDDSATTSMRWRAVMVAARLGGKLSLPDLEKNMVNRHWFLRNASLMAMAQVDRGAALTWARKMLSDKALVVRASAVDVLERLGDRDSRDLLWSKLYAPENYKGSQSLFIRRRIVETLVRFEESGQEERFIRVLGDTDPALHAPAVRALEKITNQKFGSSKEPLEFQRAHWQKWWRERTRS